MTAPRPSVRTTLLGCLVLTVCVVAAFAGVGANGFVNFDDDLYVTANPHVRGGLSLEGLRWAWTTGHSANWHPLTWMSHMLDVELFGLDAGAHHRVGLGLHTLCAVLLLLFVARVTGRPWRAFFVAALFALHPLRVESVAWAAERKDLLAGLFWVLTLHAYAAYVERRGAWRYLAVVSSLALGLLAKPMLVTLPFVLVLLDRWPLGRLGGPGGGPGPGLSLRRSLFEKLPLFALAAASSVVTVLVQAAGGAVTSDRLPLVARAANAARAYAAYLGQTVWPAGLSVYYPHRFWSEGGGAGWDAGSVAAAAGLSAATAAVFFLGRRRGWLLTGWLWYLGTLVPVIGLLQVGLQARADRYTYVPSIGIAWLVVWSVAEGVGRRRALRSLAVAAGLMALVLLGWRTRAQVRVWRDAESLWRHALAVGPENPLAHSQLASTLAETGRLEEAEAEYRAALALDRDHARSNTGLGFVLSELGRQREAMRYLYRAEALDPDHAETQLDLGLVQVRLGNLTLAEERFRKVLEHDPSNPWARSNLGAVLVATNRAEEALPELLAALAVRPELVDAQVNLGIAYQRLGRSEDAAAAFERALSLDPTQGTAHAELGRLAFRRGQAARAAEHLRAALAAGPDADLARTLAQVLATSANEAVRNGDEALRWISTARASGAGDDPRLLWIEAAAHAARGDFTAAVRVQERAVERAPATLRAEERARLEAYRARRPTLDARLR